MCYYYTVSRHDEHVCRDHSLKCVHVVTDSGADSHFDLKCQSSCKC